MIYLDYAASTPVDPEVLRAMEPYRTEKFGNPGSLHGAGQQAIAAVDRSREAVARALGAEFRQVVFTASATEANNLALRGAIAAWRRGQLRGKEENIPAAARLKKPHVIVSVIEHESVLATVRALEHEDVTVTVVPVDARGMVDEKKIKESLTAETVLVSVMYANNEIGTIQPVAAIAKTVKDFRAAARSAWPLFHTDAAQAFQFLDCGADTLGIDLMTISSHKIYGPKGAGALFVRDIKNLEPIITGGGQEFGLRSGTENVPAIAGFAKAAELARAAREKESARIAALRDELWDGLRKIFPDAEINGPRGDTERLPNILNVYFPRHAAQDLLTKLDLNGVAASSGSACRSRGMEASYVIEALGYSKARAKESIRFSLGRPTVKEEIGEVLKLFSTLFVP